MCAVENEAAVADRFCNAPDGLDPAADQANIIEAGAGQLAEAVNSYRAALTILTRDKHPLDWATTQNNLGTALAEQGKRTGGAEGAELLGQAVAGTGKVEPEPSDPRNVIVKRLALVVEGRDDAVIDLTQDLKEISKTVYSGVKDGKLTLSCG